VSVRPSVRLSVCHRKEWTNRAVFWYGGFLPPISWIFCRFVVQLVHAVDKILTDIVCPSAILELLVFHTPVLQILTVVAYVRDALFLRKMRVNVTLFLDRRLFYCFKIYFVDKARCLKLDESVSQSVNFLSGLQGP